MEQDLTCVFTDDPEGREALEVFLGTRLAAARVWLSARESDGLGRTRLLERGPDVLRIAGWIWSIQQGEENAFWIEIERERPEVDENPFRWKLYYGSTEKTKRRAKNAVDLYERPEEGNWAAELTGIGRVEDGTFRAKRRK